MPLVARASKTVRMKNIVIVLMCVGFFIPFAYDAFIGYPNADDQAVAHWKNMLENDDLRPDDSQRTRWTSAFNHWPRWKNATPAQRQEMDAIHDVAKGVKGGDVKWLSPFDITLQIYLALGLAAAVIASIWWLIHCQKRRAVADDNTVSPAPGVTIPWEKISVIDNTRWKKSGIVEITYTDSAGKAKQATFDDYELDREPLLSILDLLAEKALNAEFIPKEDAAPAAPQSPA